MFLKAWLSTTLKRKQWSNLHDKPTENLAVSWEWFPCLYFKRRPFSPVLPISSPVLLRWGEVNEQLCGCLTASWGQPTAISNLLRKSTCRFVSGLTFLFLYFHMCLGVCYLQAGLLRERLWAHDYGHIYGHTIMGLMCTQLCVDYYRCKH